MKRTLGALLVVFAVLVVAPLGAKAQQPAKTARIGVLLFGTPESEANLPAFRHRLEELGWVEGKTLTTVYRFADGRPERLAALAGELVALKPDVIFALGGDVAPFARTATQTIPIVMAVSVDPVRTGLVASLVKPGGNVTGVTFVSSELAAKRLQFLKQAAPRTMRVAILWNPDHVDPEYSETQAAGKALAIRVQSLEVRAAADLEPAFQAAAKANAEAVVVVSSRLMTFNRQRIQELAARHRIALVAGWGPWVDSGALLSYGPDLDAIVGRAATHVDRILRGASPAGLPVEQPTKLDLKINQRTARAMGLAMPSSLLLQAAHVVE
ncbi:MAG: ABC transporter substrate-binding protein [Caldimonas sp.]